MEENKKRIEENPEYYRLRQQITEHQFGTLKRQWGFTHTLMKGKQNVLSEVNLIMICYNIKRLVSILDTKVLKDRLKRLVPIFFGLLEEISAPRADFLLSRIPHPHSDTT
ncbi:transposase [Psychroflexus torquis]|uniref:transposase n=1 Tax=Psychroflexus torquis TaxID=57029 RepID=UPI0000D540D3